MNNYAQDIRQFRNLGGMTEAEKIVSCYAPFQSLHINKHGWCRPCPFSFHDLRPSPAYWSINNSLLDIWNNDIIEKNSRRWTCMNKKSLIKFYHGEEKGFMHYVIFERDVVVLSEIDTKKVRYIEENGTLNITFKVDSKDFDEIKCYTCVTFPKWTLYIRYFICLF